MTPYRLHAPLLTPVRHDDTRWHPAGVLAVDEHGRILYAGDASSLPEAYQPLPRVDALDVLLPGFVDCHTHLPQYDCRGKFGKTLLDWLETFIFPAEARFADEHVARDTAQRFFAGLRDAGTTTAMVYASEQVRATDVAFEEARRSGLRVLMGKVQMDRDVPDALRETAEQSLRDTRALIERWHRRTEKLWYVVTPRFAPVCSEPLLRGCARLAAEYGTHIQTHINESPQEISAVRALFPDAASYTDLYRRCGLLTDRTVLGHNIHASDEELALCEAHGAAVAHCPESNLFLGSGRFPLERYERRAIRFGLGSDVGAGTTLSLFAVLRAMSWAQGRSLHPSQLLYRATLGGAEALGMADDIGSLEEGKLADFIAVRVDRHFCGGKTLEQLKPIEIASAIAYRSQPADVRGVWVGGERMEG
jgi:guanine deaminase